MFSRQKIKIIAKKMQVVAPTKIYVKFPKKMGVKIRFVKRQEKGAAKLYTGISSFVTGNSRDKQRKGHELPFTAYR